MKKKEDISGLAFVGSFFIGLALGFYSGQVVIGVLGGLGVGFILMAIVRYLLNK